MKTICECAATLLLGLLSFNIQAQARVSPSGPESRPVCKLPPQDLSKPWGDGYRYLKRELVERLCWETLWADAKGIQIRIPPSGSISLTAYLAPKFLFYCSHDLGNCAQYEAQYGMKDFHLGIREKSVQCGGSTSPCKSGQNDRTSVLAFVHQIDPTLPTSDQPIPIPMGEISNRRALQRAQAATFITWTIETYLGTKAETAEYYRQLRPPELSDLEQWFRARNAGTVYRSIMIPCFAMSDPVVYLYGQRTKLGPIILAEQWSVNKERWEDSFAVPFFWGAPTPEQQKKIDRYRQIIESIKCSTLRFSSR